MTDVHICHQLTFLIDKSINCQNAKKKYFLLHYLETLNLFATKFFVNRPRHIAIRAYLLFLYYIVISN